MKKNLQIYVVVAPGLEAVCHAEAVALGLPEARQCEGGVTFQGGLRELYLANLWLRSATRVLVRVDEVGARDFPELFRKTVRLPWGSFIRPGTAVQVRVTSRRSRLIHSGRIAETVSAAITHALGGQANPPDAAEQLVLVRFEDDRCLFSVDSSGELLHRRGYRVAPGAAPLRENLAAAMLLVLGWDGSQPLCDPLCGSGTIPIEAAMLAGYCAPGASRCYAFMRWPGFRAGLWDVLLKDAAKMARTPLAAIAGSDRAADAIEMARANAARAGVGEWVDFSVGRMEEQAARAGSGLLICNPPYGVRLESLAELAPLYRAIGESSRRSFPGWRVALLAPHEQLVQQTGLPFERIAAFANGGIPVGLYATRPVGVGA